MPDRWYYKILGEEFGPVPFDGLAGLVRAHNVSPNDEVRDGAEGPWVPANSIVGLFAEPEELHDLSELDFHFAESGDVRRNTTPTTPGSNELPEQLDELSKLVFEIINSSRMLPGPDSSTSAPESASSLPAETADDDFEISVPMLNGPLREPSPFPQTTVPGKAEVSEAATEARNNGDLDQTDQPEPGE